VTFSEVRVARLVRDVFEEISILVSRSESWLSDPSEARVGGEFRTLQNDCRTLDVADLRVGDGRGGIPLSRRR
jgi:hypothetical protein